MVVVESNIAREYKDILERLCDKSSAKTYILNLESYNNIVVTKEDEEKFKSKKFTHNIEYAN